MFSKKFGLLLVLFLAFSMVLAACQTPPAEEPEEPMEEEMTEEEPMEEEMTEEEPMEEEPAEEEPAEEEPAEEMMDLSGTTVSFWHVYGEGDARSELIFDVVDEFNATNEYGITVEAFDQGDYQPIVDAVNAGIQSGDLPNVVQAFTSDLASWDLVDQVVDLNQYLEDPDYGLSADEMASVYPSVLQLGLAGDGARIGWPFSQSANVMVYNYTWAAELGFDSPPTTPEELKEQVCAAAEANATDDNPDNDGTGGMVWFPSTSNFMSFLHAWGDDGLNDAGDAYQFNTPEAAEVAAFINDLRDSGCTLETESFPNPEQAQRLALVTLSSTAGLPFYQSAFEDAGNDDEWGFIAFPGPDGGQGVDSFTQTIGVLKSTPEQELASWLFVKYLTSAQNQADWVEVSGYLPTQTATEELLGDFIEGNPVYGSMLSLASLAQAEPETFAAWSSVRRAVGDAAAAMYQATSEDEITAILEQLDADAADFVAELE